MDNNNLIAAVILSILILVGFQYLYVKPQQEHYRQLVLAQKLAQTDQTVVPGTTPAALRNRADVIKEEPRVVIDTPELEGSINLKGSRFDDLRLVKYHQTVDDETPVTLLSPSGSAQPYPAYYAEFSWLGDAGTAVPTAQTEWKTVGQKLTPEQPLILTWDNGQGLKFVRTITVDKDYMFTLTDRVQNTTDQAVTLYPFGLLARQGNPVIRTSRTSHEGPLAVLNGTLEEFDYKKLMENGKSALESQGGWLGMTDKYWLAALVVPEQDKITAEFSYNGTSANQDPNLGYYQTDFRGAAMKIEPHDTMTHTARFFAGAKRLRLLDQYADQGNIPHFDRAIDFGWFYFLTKPFLYLLDFLGRCLGGVGLAILAFTVGLKLLTLPLSLKSYHSMSRMKALQPEMKAIQERFAEDKTRQSQEVMELYKRKNVSPLSGCLPTLIQIPIFFALYKILYVGIELRQAPFYGWIKDMSVPDPTTVFNAFGAIPIELPAALHIGVWPLLMGCSMFLQQRLSPQPPDKTQARMFMFMPLMFTYMLSQMPAGLVIYWTWSNLLSIAQQWFIMGRDAKKAPA